MKSTILDILNRGVVTQILPSKEEFIKAAQTKKLRIYIGIDATSDTLHLSHAKNFMLLEEFRRLGHQAIVLFGDFTARIGDPSDRDSARTRLTKNQVKHNIDSWISQIKSLIDFDARENPALIKYNSNWLAKLDFEEILNLATNFTIQQMIERDMFQKRLKNDKPIYLHEFLYPLMQGYDSVAMDVDVELCGTDQIFNALAGRTLQKRINGKDKFVVALNLMEDPETGLLMSKSRGTGVFLNTSAEELYRSAMSLPDSMTELLFINNTRVPRSEIKSILSGDALEAKQRAAFEITSLMHGSTKARAAQDEFVRKVRRKKLREQDFQEIEYKDGQQLWEVLVQNNVVASRNEYRRLIEARAIDQIDNANKTIAQDSKAQSGKYRVGKKRYVKLILA